MLVKSGGKRRTACLCKKMEWLKMEWLKMEWLKILYFINFIYKLQIIKILLYYSINVMSANSLKYRLLQVSTNSPFA
jgi:hypothetical protein